MKIIVPFKVILLIIALGSMGCESKTKRESVQEPVPMVTVDSKSRSVEVKVIKSGNNHYGYDIHMDGKKFIHQPHMPGVPGNKGFANQEIALKVGEFVAEKIKRNVIPPTISVQELKEIGAL